jgi:hypothetical protein
MINEQVQWLIHPLVKDELMRRERFLSEIEKNHRPFPTEKAFIERVDEPLMV